MQPPGLADTADRIISPHRERLITMQNNWKEPRSILMSSRDRVAHIDATQLVVSNNTLPAEYNVSTKPSNSFTNVCWVSVLTTFSAPPQILAASTVFFCPIPETKKWWVMVSFGATAAGLFWTVNVCWAHPGCWCQVAVWVAFFSWCYSWCFLKFAESYVEN